jgi:hypothetical protein
MVWRSYGRRLLALNVSDYALQVSNAEAVIRLFGKYKLRDYGKTWQRSEFLRELMKLI